MCIQMIDLNIIHHIHECHTLVVLCFIVHVLYHVYDHIMLLSVHAVVHDHHTQIYVI